MDFDAYVAARYGRLIEHAVLLGVADGEAGTYVDHVLLQNKKAIRRAEDPDPLVHAALDRAISGTPDRRARTGPFVALGLVALAVAVGLALSWRPPPKALPSLFALHGDQAQALLEGQGYDVVLRPARACEPSGLVLSSDPPAGALARKGQTVTVRTAVPSGVGCDEGFADRAVAWQFLAFARGEGPAPTFTQTVTVVVDQQDPYRIDQVAAVSRERWGGVMDRIARSAAGRAPTTSGMPRLAVEDGVLPSDLCGVPKPDGTGDRRVLRLQVDARADGDESTCPLTVDLYRDSAGAIDGVVVYTPKDALIKPAGRLREASPAGE
ncbi:hypothetical protein G5V58_24185 [Nocardioides anomalus]|uniref:PASTA domain-containing protein n=1 Tax=Nocardioides anomalus TaxID=2712223 RepID=A0A6G6WJQ3_9ACTN|nr:hypothetical protein [Nocardioides anomalus]QIG45436.1 hypothetical protein G5V58_24185 [Nocardioides anomalus]